MSFYKKTWKSLRSHDMFGHLITMNFNKRGPKHQTQIGAIFSLIIKFAIYVYVVLTFKTLLSQGADKNSTISSAEAIDQLGRVSYSTSRQFTFYVLRS